MFESIIAGILSRFLGDYVEGLEAENLSLSIVGGNVVLENLRLKKEALADLEVPLVVKDGTDCMCLALVAERVVPRCARAFLLLCRCPQPRRL